jgi:hypothetical protein
MRALGSETIRRTGLTERDGTLPAKRRPRLRPTQPLRPRARVRRTSMFTGNPFAAVTDALSPLAMRLYIVLMILAVVVGTLIDVARKGSRKFYEQRRERSKAFSTRQLRGGQALSLAIATIAEAAVSGEFTKWPRRASHLLMMYGFFLYVIATVAMVFASPAGGDTPAILPALWTIGALMILVGGLWFFFVLRVNVAYDGASPFHLGRADLFIGSLLASVIFALAWHFVQTTFASATTNWILFALYIFFTTVLFVTVPWSKFAHMFFKPALAYQRRVEEANGSSDLPAPGAENFIVRS